jgi:hypothetical protein
MSCTPRKRPGKRPEVNGSTALAGFIYKWCPERALVDMMMDDLAALMSVAINGFLDEQERKAKQGP